MLTPTQLAARQGKLTASRVACLMNGDLEAILRLYREMIGQELPEDLSKVWAVQLGIVTESLNLDWYEMKGNPLVGRGLVKQHPKYEWAACTLDAWDTTLRCPVECKQVGGREPMEIIIDRYQPQMQWQIECTSATQCALSVIMGAREPIVEYIPRDEEYAAEMVKRGQQFMDCVARRVPPVELTAVPAPVDASKVYNLTGNNEWSSYAVEWLDSRAAAERHKDAQKLLKEMVPEDAKKCYGHGVRITRDRAGRLSLREDA